MTTADSYDPWNNTRIFTPVDVKIPKNVSRKRKSYAQKMNEYQRKIHNEDDEQMNDLNRNLEFKESGESTLVMRGHKRIRVLKEDIIIDEIHKVNSDQASEPGSNLANERFNYLINNVEVERLCAGKAGAGRKCYSGQELKKIMIDLNLAPGTLRKPDLLKIIIQKMKQFDLM